MNIPEVKCGIISVSRDCFIISLSQNRRQAIVDAYTKQYGDLYEVPTVVENETDMLKAVEEAKAAGVLVAGTGRSDAPNQVNNVCVFPGIFRGALAVRASAITEEMKVAAVRAIAGLIPEDELREDYVVPGAFDRRIVPAIAGAVAKVAMSAGIARLKREVQDIEKEAAERVLHNWNA